jgi:hypothetical protein
MAPPHLGLELLGDPIGGELAALLGDDELKRQVRSRSLSSPRMSSASPWPMAWSSSSTSSTR